MNDAAKRFVDYLDDKGIKYDTDEIEENSVVKVGYNLENTTVKATIFFSDDNKHLAMRCFNIVQVPKDKLANILVACNKTNREYRWVKFVINDEMEVNAQTDAIIGENSSGDVFELMYRILGIVDEVYPSFMKAIWA